MVMPEEAFERSLSRDLNHNHPSPPVGEAATALKSCAHACVAVSIQYGFCRPDKGCPALGASAPSPLLAGPSQALQGHRTSTFPPNHTQTFSPEGNRTMVQTERGKKRNS